MARTRAPSNLLSLVESDSEDDLGVPKSKTTTAATTATKRASIRDMPPAKRGRPSAASTAGAATSKVTKPAQKKADTSAATRRATERKGAAAAAAALEADTSTTTATAKSTSRSQRVLADKTNEMTIEPAEEVAPAKPRGRPGRKAAAPVAADPVESETEEAPAVPKKRGRGRPKAANTTTNENEDPQASKPAKRGRRSAASSVEEDTTIDVDGGNDDEADVSPQESEATEADFTDTMDIEPTETKSVDIGNTFRSPLRRGRPNPPVPTSAVRGRGSSLTTSASDDASVRRRLGELTKKYDTLEAQYRNLKEIGVKEAERNFDRLKKQGEDRAKVSNDLIASLKAELASFREQARDGAKAKREWEASEVRASDLQAQVAELKKALEDAKAASKTLSTKLAAARTAAEMPALSAGMTVPGSAIKSSAPTTASARAAVEAMQANSQMAQLKEDLYGDLTGLLVRSALRQGGREMYDCIQTGRNGSLHFKLCIDEEDADNNDSDSAQFVYTPQLDPRRDAALIEQLPDYLVEEISFPRMQAAKFYKRVMQALTEDQ
ncbi:hypothetical protein SEUCBS139899_000927 [Sporothrix eucalyptigena]|uniref:Monopolin complex subunit Csm1/Pcs1 C-terminal domain-containing protein n=1 Tax=Sporothrix eucalyptigena TaxID=1812306 RepID=A0ABP0BKL4_9PEZI